MVNIKDFFVWDIRQYHKLIGNILGGIRVRVMSINEIFGDHPKKKTKEIINVNFTKIYTYAATTLGPLCLNSYTIITRWLERPERNPNEFHNWSKLSLAHIEFAGLIIMVSQCFSHFTVLLMNNIVNRNYSKSKIPDYFWKKFGVVICITLLITSVLNIFILWNISSIIYEELKLFVTNELMNDEIDGIKTNETSLNDTSLNFTSLNFTDTNDSITYVDDTDFGQLDHSIFLLLGISFYIKYIPNGFFRLVNFDNEIKIGNISEKKFKRKNISIYDPYSIREINHNIQHIGKFSLLGIMIWGRHQLPRFITDKWHSNKHYINLITFSMCRGSSREQFETLCFTCFCICSMLVILTLVFGLFLVTTGFGFIGLIIKVNQVSFVGEIELIDWEYAHWIQFAGFLNNMLALDTSKKNSFDSILTFLFAGEDAIEDKDEKESKEAFLDAVTCYSLTEQGVIKTLIILPQIGTSEIQKIFIDESEKIRLIEEEEINEKRKEEMKEKNQWVNHITESEKLVLFDEMPQFYEDD
jgi:hypothetical protein